MKKVFRGSVYIDGKLIWESASARRWKLMQVRERKVKVLDPEVDPEYCAMLSRAFADIEAGRVSRPYTIEELRAEQKGFWEGLHAIRRVKTRPVAEGIMSTIKDKEK